MKNGRFEILFGTAFGGIGFFVAAICIYVMTTGNGRADNPVVGIIVGIIFGLVGVLVILIGVNSAMKAHDAFKNGRHYPAKILEYDADEHTRINGRPVLMLVVRYYLEDGSMREAIVTTGGINEKKFPRGGTVEIAEHLGTAYLVSKAATMDALPGESELMKPESLATDPSGAERSGFTPAGAISGGNISVACPNCGTVFSIPPGSSIACGCGRTFTLTHDHMII